MIRSANDIVDVPLDLALLGLGALDDLMEKLRLELESGNRGPKLVGRNRKEHVARAKRRPVVGSTTA